MKIFLSGFESQDMDKWLEVDPELKLKYVLMSYQYIKHAKEHNVGKIIELAENVLVDSGAHTFQKHSDSMDWDAYTHEYGQWIQEHDEDKMAGYFEMDIDNIIGYDRVRELREILYGYTDKVIPVWHWSRGPEGFEEMCIEASQHSHVVSFSGVADTVSIDEMRWMLKTAWEHGCKLHALGITSKRIIDTVPFDYVDSSSWLMETMFGRIGGNDIRRVKQMDGVIARMSSHELWQRKQQFYYDKWRGVSPMGD